MWHLRCPDLPHKKQKRENIRSGIFPLMTQEPWLVSHAKLLL
jgi:hypothetical protein